MLLVNLPTDLIHDVLLKLDSREALAACISSGRSLRDVFKMHPNSVLRQVFCNEIGMDVRVLPYAWAHLKYLGNAHLPAGMTPPVRNTCPGLEDSLTVSVTPYTLVGLKQGHQLVRRMAQYFSIRFKEGRVLRDTLTTEETRRFHIAAYLFCHYQTIWRRFQSPQLYSLDDIDEDDDDSGHPDSQDIQTMEACHGFLHRLSTNELFWIQQIRDFLLQDINYALNLKEGLKTFDQAISQDFNYHGRKFTLDFWRHHLLSTSLAYFRHWKAVMRSPVYAPMRLEKDGLWLTDAISLVMSERDVMNQAKEDPDASILQSKGILIPACQRCGLEPHGQIAFYNKTNLEEIKVAWDHRGFPGLLSSNAVEMQRVLNRIYPSSTPGERDNRMEAVKEIMDHAEIQAALRLEKGGSSRSDHSFPATDVPSEDDGEDAEVEQEMEPEDSETEVDGSILRGYQWSPDDVLCVICFSTILKGLYFDWWVDERQTDRVQPHMFQRYCALGFECRVQSNLKHSIRLDHCCPGPRARNRSAGGANIAGPVVNAGLY